MRREARDDSQLRLTLDCPLETISGLFPEKRRSTKSSRAGRNYNSRRNGQSQITSAQRKTKLHRHRQAYDMKLVPREAQVVSAGPVLVHIILGQPVSGIIANNSSSNSSQLYLLKASVITVLLHLATPPIKTTYKNFTVQ